MKAVVAAFNQEKALVGAFSVLTNLRMELFQALIRCQVCGKCGGQEVVQAEEQDLLHHLSQTLNHYGAHLDIWISRIFPEDKTAVVPFHSLQ